MGKSQSLLTGLLTGFAQQKAEKRRIEREAPLNKLKSEELKLKLQDAKNKQTLMSMLMSQLQSGNNQPPANSNIGGEQGDLIGGLDSKFSDSFPQQPSQLGVTGQSKPQQLGVTDQMAISQMNPMLAALMKQATGIDVLGAQRYGETARHNQVVEGNANRNYNLGVDRLGETKRSNQFSESLNFAKFNREGGQVVNEQVTIDGVPHLQPVNAITKEPVGNPKPIGGKKGMPAESAGKVAMAVNAKKYVKQLESMMINPDGSINKGLIFKMSVPGGGIDEGRIALSLFGDAVDARIRAATGAAVSKEDWELYKRIYMPTVMDLTAGPEQVKQKLGRFTEFIDSYLSTLDPESIYQGGKQQTLPKDAVSQLSEGEITTFGNGQEWTLKGGEPVRVK